MENSKPVSLHDITIRHTLRPGDLGYITYLHGYWYKKEYDYTLAFETYVAKGLLEFFERYDEGKECLWICEHESKIIGFLLLMNRNTAAQLRYFIIVPQYRGIGLGKKLMQLYVDFLRKSGYTSSYLWTTDELFSAASLYKRYGFVLTEEVESTAFGKPLREQKYVLHL
jgi:GNAT superfamily N-acetyltransferase